MDSLALGTSCAATTNMESRINGLTVEALEKKATTLFAQHQCGQAKGLSCWLLRSLPRFNGWTDAMILDAVLDREELCLALARALGRPSWAELCRDVAAARGPKKRAQTAEYVPDMMLRRWRGLLEELSNHNSIDFAIVALSRDEQIVPIVVHPAEQRERLQPRPGQLARELEVLCRHVTSQQSEQDSSPSIVIESFPTANEGERGLLAIGKNPNGAPESATFQAQLELIRRIFRIDFETLDMERTRQEGIQRLLFPEVKEKTGEYSMVTMCAHCKAIKKGSGHSEEWSPVEHYIALGCGGSLSHGICPSCIEQYYPTRMQSGE